MFPSQRRNNWRLVVATCLIFNRRPFGVVKIRTAEHPMFVLTEKRVIALLREGNVNLFTRRFIHVVAQYDAKWVGQRKIDLDAKLDLDPGADKTTQVVDCIVQ